MALDKQINLFRVDTNAFLFEDEKILHARKSKIASTILLAKEKINKSKNQWFIDKHNKQLTILREEARKAKMALLDFAADQVRYNRLNAEKRIRCLDERYLSYIDSSDGNKKINISNVISMFESTLSRSFGIHTNELTYDIFILEIYYYDIAQDLIVNGFDYNGKHYVYFSSSAGQIRTKKAVFVEQEKFESCKLKLMCGLTIEKINELGGMNINKFLAYLALVNSATDTWDEVFGLPFDIDRAIVVDDFETLVKCKVDNIDYITYEITPNVVQNMPIPHTDGCGMILSSYSSKNFMIRLPFIKGLLGSFDFVRFINEHDCSPIVKDIWGKEYNIIEDNIQIILTKSQLKMFKYYSSWDEYKNYFKLYNCEACVCNMEEDKIMSAKINYQMLQTLYDASDKEIAEMCKIPNKKIKEVSDSLENALSFFGVHMDEESEEHKDFYQKSLKIYPELLNEPSAKEDLKNLKNSLINKYRSAKLDVQGKFTFVLPDLYAFCEHLFLGIEKPLGLLENNEVFCRLYKNSTELDCLRSPHLYIEHAIRNNVCNKKYRNQRLDSWFTTDAIYTSTHDLISRILQFDVDGDRLLVLAQKSIIAMAKRCMMGVNPLYYEMKKANAEQINSYTIYKGLKLAFTGGNIGGISNDITKIWNSGEITEESLKAVRWLCMETNFTIDYAKTLYKPTRPKHVDKILKHYSKQKVPYFFYYAKNKSIDRVDEINNSTINRITKVIKDNRNMFKPIKKLGALDYTVLLKDRQDIYYNEELNKVFDRWNKKYGNFANFDEDNTNKNNLSIISTQVKNDLHAIELDDDKIINSLVTFLYKTGSTRKKRLLWYLYGEKLYNNILENVDSRNICLQCGVRTDEELVRGKCSDCRKEEIQQLGGLKTIKCIDCGTAFEVAAKSRAKLCDVCKEVRYKERHIRYNQKRK